MELGMVGAGRMGGNMTRRLQGAGHRCVVYDRQPLACQALAEEGIAVAEDLSALVAALTPPRAIWMMVPHGEPTQLVLDQLLPLLSAGDTVIDGGNSHFQEAIHRAEQSEARGVRFLDVGTSGGVHGLQRGYCLMVGGPEAAYLQLETIFSALSPGADAAAAPAEQGYLYCGGPGAGHYAKMIHNGIEYGMMQAFAEGFELLRTATSASASGAYHYDFDLPQLAQVWRRGSVVSSWLLDLTAEALRENPSLEGFSSAVSDSGEGRWTVNAAVDQAVAAPVLTAALYARFRSRQSPHFPDMLLSAMRYKFGGHVKST